MTVASLIVGCLRCDMKKPLEEYLGFVDRAAGQHGKQLLDCARLLVFVGIGFVKRWNIARECLAKIVNEAHFDDLVHIQFGIFVGTQHCHDRKSPRMLGNALLPSA